MSLELMEANICLVFQAEGTGNGVGIADRKVEEHGEDAHGDAFLIMLARICRMLLVHAIDGTHEEIVCNNNCRSLEHFMIHYSLSVQQWRGAKPWTQWMACASFVPSPYHFGKVPSRSWE